MKIKKALRIVLIAVGVILVAALVRTAWTWTRGALNRHMVAARAQETGTRPARTYYVDTDRGEDDNSGTGPEAAWRTLERAGRVSLRPGDRLLLHAGQRFPGSLQIDADDYGTPRQPIVVGSFGGDGDQRATIDAGAGNGITVRNTLGVRVQNLNVNGAGRDRNHGSGIAFVNDLDGDVKLPAIHVENVDVRGFGKWGVLVDGNNGKSGFEEVRIAHVRAHENGEAGIYVYGQFDPVRSDYAHRNVTIQDCEAFRNTGIPGPKRDNTGSGIVVSDVDGGRIEHCLAYENGALCDSEQGGPVGIWGWDANNLTIQFNESFRNRVAGRKDGGGFDLDGGCTNSVVQYNYSHDNDGAGYFLAQFPFARRFAANTIRYNISENDGRRNGYAGIACWGNIDRARIYNNTVFVGPAAEGSPTVLSFMPEPGAVIRAVEVYNNLLCTKGGLSVVRMRAAQKGIRLEGNAYHAADGALRIDWDGATYTSLASWRTATKQETLGKSLDVDPRLERPGGGGGGGGTVRAFRIRPDSPLIGAGVDLVALGIDPGRRDYYGNALPNGGRSGTIGANHPTGAATREGRK